MSLSPRSSPLRSQNDSDQHSASHDKTVDNLTFSHSVIDKNSSSLKSQSNEDPSHISVNTSDPKVELNRSLSGSPLRDSRTNQDSQGDEDAHVDSVSSMTKLRSRDNSPVTRDQTRGRPGQASQGEQNSPPKTDSAESGLPPEEDLAVRIQKSKSYKDTAKVFVKGGHYDDAIRIYESAYYVLKPSVKDRQHPDLRKSIQLQNEIFNNLSYCYGCIERYQESIAYAKRVLITDKDNVKALFRLAVAYKNIGETLNAYDEIKKCKAAFMEQNEGKPLDSKIRELYVELQDSSKELLKQRKQNEKEIYSRMMGNKANNEPASIGYSISGLSPRVSKWLIYGMAAGPTCVLAVIGWRIAKQRTVEAAKRAAERHLPTIITAIAALMCLRYVKNHYRKTFTGLTLATAAAILVYKTSYNRTQ